MKVIFSHGKESGPWGAKILQLAEIAKSRNLQVDSIDYQAMPNPDERVKHLLLTLDLEADPIILVGSSMGGYVSLLAAGHENVKAAFLLAPALYLPTYKISDYPILSKRIEIVHGWHDEVIPYEHSVRYGLCSGCPVHLIDGDHRLNSSMAEVTKLFTSFLDSSVR